MRSTSSPKRHGSRSGQSFALWMRISGSSTPACSQRTNSSASGSPWKPPMSAPAKGWPASPKEQVISSAARRCSQVDSLSPFQLKA